MTIIQIDSGQLEILMMCFYGFLIAVIGLVALGSAWMVWEFWVTPKESKEIRTAKRKKQPITFTFDDSHRGFFQRLVRVGPSGAASTRKSFSDRKANVYFFARKGKPTFYKPTDSSVAAENLANEIDELQSSKIFLSDAKVPISFAYKGKALLTSIYALTGVQAAEIISKADDKEQAITEPCPYCGQTQSPLKILSKINIDITTFFKNISNLKAWDQSGQRENQVDAFGHGMEEAKRGMGKQPMIILLLALALCFGLGILLVVATYLLK